MNVLFRTLLTWLVLLAIPFQGYASAAALPCTGAAGAAPAAAAQVAVAQEQAPMAASPHHDHRAMLLAAAAHHQHAQASDAGHGNAGHGPGSHAKCGSCPACWVGPAMLPPAPGPLAVQPPARASIPFDPGHVPAFHPSLPERPPRTPVA